MLRKHAKLPALKLAIALGLAWGSALLIIGLLAWQCDLGASWVGVLSGLYMGFAPTCFGCLIGAGLGFIDGFVAGLLIAWFYNRYLKHYNVNCL